MLGVSRCMPSPSMKTTLALILLALVGASALLGSPWMRQQFELADLSTDSQQQISRHLEDGSLLVLRPDTAVDIEYSPQQRRLTVLTGGIYLEVAASDPRPLLLVTDHGTLAIHAAQLTLDRLPEQTQVSVQAGSAVLQSGGRQIHLGAADALSFDASGPVRPSP